MRSTPPLPLSQFHRHNHHRRRELPSFACCTASLAHHLSSQYDWKAWDLWPPALSPHIWGRWADECYRKADLYGSRGRPLPMIPYKDVPLRGDIIIPPHLSYFFICNGDRTHALSHKSHACILQKREVLFFDIATQTNIQMFLSYTQNIELNILSHVLRFLLWSKFWA